MQFKDVLGQQQLKSHIVSLVNNNKLPHAINFTGTEGSGNLAMAWATAQYIHCTQKIENDSCGVCAACEKVAMLQHPDLLMSFPVISTGKANTSSDFYNEFRSFITQFPYGNVTDWLLTLGENKQGNINVTECREIIRRLLLSSFESDYKVLIMWHPEYLGKEGNILLKLIEEPPANTVMIFVTEDIDKLLPTIQSRTQVFALQRLQNQDIVNALQKYENNEEKALRCALMSEGNYHEALRLFTQSDHNYAPLCLQWFYAMWHNKGIDMMDWIKVFLEENKEAQKNILLYLIQCLRLYMQVVFLQQKETYLPKSELDFILFLKNNNINYIDIIAIYKMLNDTIYKIERNANMKILIHELSLQIQKQLLLRKQQLAK